MRVGLVLGAGGSVGVAFHGAVVATLEEATGWDPRTAELIVGTSAGSITGACLRAGLPASDLTRISEDLPLSEDGEAIACIGRPHRPRPRSADLFNFRPVADPLGLLHGLTHPLSHPRAAMAVAGMPAGTVPTDAISSGINAVFDGRWPSKALWLCSVDLRSGRRVVFGREGSPPAQVGSAVAASSAVPAYFKPVAIAGRRYVDGGVHSMANVDLVAGLDLDLVVVSAPVSQSSAWPAMVPNGALRQLMRARLHAEMSALRAAGVAVVAIEPGRRVLRAMGPNPMDARQRGPVSRTTRSCVGQWLSASIDGRRLSALLRAADSQAEDGIRTEPSRLGRPSA